MSREKLEFDPNIVNSFLLGACRLITVNSFRREFTVYLKQHRVLTEDASQRYVQEVLELYKQLNRDSRFKPSQEQLPILKVFLQFFLDTGYAGQETSSLFKTLKAYIQFH